MEVALEAGADDLVHDGDYFEVTCDPKSFDAVRKALEEARVPVEEAELGYLPTTTVELDAENAKKMLKLRDLLDENEDVQDVYSNEVLPEGVTA
jgi:transcriptional/translational regulatory protein YebC/TACO1